MHTKAWFVMLALLVLASCGANEVLGDPGEVLAEDPGEQIADDYDDEGIIAPARSTG